LHGFHGIIIIIIINGIERYATVLFSDDKFLLSFVENYKRIERLVIERARTHERMHAQTHTGTEYVERSDYFRVKFDVHLALSRGGSIDHTPEKGSCG